MTIVDPRHSMDLIELVEELTLAAPERVAAIEARHQEAMDAVVNDETADCDPELLDDLREDLVELLAI